NGSSLDDTAAAEIDFAQRPTPIVGRHDGDGERARHRQEGTMTENYWQRRLSRRSALRGGVLAATGLGMAALVGCGSDEDTSTATPGGGGGGGGTATATATSGPSVQRGGTLNVGFLGSTVQY